MITTNEAEEILKKEYHHDNFLFLIKNILFTDFQRDEHIVNYNGILFNSIKQLGYSLNGNLAIFEIYLKNGNENKRVTLTREMFKILSSLGVNQALCSFVTCDLKNYRLSLLTSKYEEDSNKAKKVFSNPRRYSYSLGVGTKTKTAYQFLINKGYIHTIDDLIQRFSIETVNKQFYSEISRCFNSLVKPEKNNLFLSNCSDKKKYAEFGVRLIGRILFCWFLRKKTSTRGIPIISDDFFEINNISGDDYYNEVLEPLFFELLNTEQEKRKAIFRKPPFEKIPYLNGGLFSPIIDDKYEFDEDIGKNKPNNVTISNKWFAEFYDILGQYNFTVDENSSYDIELSIDPEMLGRIFENLLAEINPETGETARKSTGSFYTPREIVEYMVNCSLLSYLRSKTRVDEIKLKKLINYSDIYDNQIFGFEEKESIVTALFSIAILDPACGSGAFPIGMLQKIVYILELIDPNAELWFNLIIKDINELVKQEIKKKFDSGSLNYIRKLAIIQNSIFGVDIQPIAVEISRLRCFLSLVIEETVEDDEFNRGINPLPNLDFKFIVANSLVKLDDNSQISLYSGDEDIKKLKTIRDKYFTASNEERLKLKQDFYSVQNLMKENIKTNFYGLNSKKYEQLSSWDPFKNETTNWFDSEWMFGIKEGFDIVISNPPYVATGNRNTNHRLNEEQKEYYRNTYVNSAEYKINLYPLFMELAIDLTKKGGVSSYIVPDSFLLGRYFSKIRKYILEQNIIRYIALLGSDIFSACVGYSVVYMFEKTKPSEETQMKFIRASKSEGFIDDKISFSYPQDYAMKLDRHRFRIFFDSKTKNLVDKIEKGSTKLGIGYTGHTGVRAKKGKNSIISKSQLNANYKKGIISGSQIKPYKIEYNNDWINIDSAILHAGGFNAEVNENPKIMIRQTADTLICALDDNGYYHLNCIHSFSPKDFKKPMWNLKYILAVLNSSLMKWFYETIAYEKGRPLAQTDIDVLETLPIKISLEYSNEIESLVSNIDKIEDLSNMQRYIKKIDSLVYEIYNINDEEQLLIENKN